MTHRLRARSRRGCGCAQQTVAKLRAEHSGVAAERLQLAITFIATRYHGSSRVVRPRRLHVTSPPKRVLGLVAPPRPEGGATPRRTEPAAPEASQIILIAIRRRRRVAPPTQGRWRREQTAVLPVECQVSAGASLGGPRPRRAGPPGSSVCGRPGAEGGAEARAEARERAWGPAETAPASSKKPASDRQTDGRTDGACPPRGTDAAPCPAPALPSAPLLRPQTGRCYIGLRGGKLLGAPPPRIPRRCLCSPRSRGGIEGPPGAPRARPGAPGPEPRYQLTEVMGPACPPSSYRTMNDSE
uniref:translation initiation factor IF-2-like n=1 Tax=Nyctereutes procyonoides TaxID=34880 RepID=UPI0024441058|nr:translation initiation factor IF-2-like [Nyctereutes procyonoides]